MRQLKQMVLVLGTREFSECWARPNFLNTVFIWHENRDEGWSEYNTRTQIFNSDKKRSPFIVLIPHQFTTYPPTKILDFSLQYRGADKSLAWPEGKRATATEVFDVHIIIIISNQPLGQFGQEPEPSQATGMALVRCILGKFLGVFNVLLTVHHAMILGSCPTWRTNSFQYIYL